MQVGSALQRRSWRQILVVVIAGLWFPCTWVQAQSYTADCTQPEKVPDFISDTATHLAAIKGNQERWRNPLHWHRLIRELDRLRIDGLSPQNYFLADIARIAGGVNGENLPAACEAELATLAMVWSLTDLRYGRLDPTELGLMWHHNPTPRDAEQFAIEIHRDFYHRSGLHQAYQRARPDAAPYVNLRNAYREFRRKLPRTWPDIPAGDALEPGDRSPRVQALAERLTAQDYLPQAAPSSELMGYPVYDNALIEAVKRFQLDHGLQSDGVVGKNTLEALNRAPATWVATIRANLERLRWISPYLAPEMVMVDIAGAGVSYHRNGRRIWQGNAQVGRPERKTPALTSAISHATVNPTWTIPPTVFYEDTLPAIQQNPDYLEKNRLTVLDRSGNVLDPENVDWSRPSGLLLRQAAGPGNALGEVAIRFPNPFAVYLHDTPSQWLFNTPNRFYSSGCVRVEGAIELTRLLFRHASPTAHQRFEQVYRTGDTRNVSIPAPIPLIMGYWTAQATPNGDIRFREDTYGQDRLVVDVLDGEED